MALSYSSQQSHTVNAGREVDDPEAGLGGKKSLLKI